MTRHGFAHRLALHAETARRTMPSLAGKRIFPHLLRHTCAAHTLEATGDIRKVSLWLGHASIKSTEIYLRSDPTGKLEILAAGRPPTIKKGSFKEARRQAARDPERRSRPTEMVSGSGPGCGVCRAGALQLSITTRLPLMSEAELHMLRARLRGGLLNQARRGALKLLLPVGLVYDPLDRVGLDPDAQVQHSIRMLFDTFARTGSAGATVRYFRSEGLNVPQRPFRGADKGQLRWQPLTYRYILRMLHNPRYAGAYAYGRRRRQRRPDGSIRSEVVPIREWTVLLHDAHPGYITWERFEAHRQQLRDNTQGRGRRGPPREGPALLQGLALCGVCGRKMSVRYHLRRDRRVPDYVCPGDFRKADPEGASPSPGPASTVPSASSWSS